TYSGHPTAAAVGLKNIEIIEKENLVENSRKMGEKLLEGFKDLKKKLNHVGDVRAMGLLGAIELMKDPEKNINFSPEEKVAPRVIESLFNRGVICRPVTFEGSDIIAFSPPLIINEAQIEDLLSKVHDA